MSDAHTPAGWYEDPTQVGELRYHDGTHWTEHVTIDGVQTTAPYDELANLAANFTMSRAAQWRSEDERPVEVVGSRGLVGSFVPVLDGVPGYRFQDAGGGVVVTLSKPSLKSQLEVLDAGGYAIGTITKVGRLRSRYDVTSAQGAGAATVKLASGASDDWELLIDGVVVATYSRVTRTPADPLNFADVEYHATTIRDLDDRLERLYLVVPLAIDILDTQVVAH